MTRSDVARYERAALYAALERARLRDTLGEVDAAQLHRDLHMTCYPATSRRWVRQWRTETAVERAAQSG